MIFLLLVAYTVYLCHFGEREVLQAQAHFQPKELCRCWSSLACSTVASPISHASVPSWSKATETLLVTLYYPISGCNKGGHSVAKTLICLLINMSCSYYSSHKELVTIPHHRGCVRTENLACTAWKINSIWSQHVEPWDHQWRQQLPFVNKLEISGTHQTWSSKLESKSKVHERGMKEVLDATEKKYNHPPLS